mgnify:CR=1 FL=1
MAKKKPEFDENGKLKNKESLILGKVAELRRTYKGIDESRKKNAEMLIPNAAFMCVSMMELENIINKKGYSEEYQNGANQKGVKKCSEVETYNNFAKNYLSYIKQLDDMLQKSGDPNKDDELTKFLTGGG